MGQCQSVSDLSPLSHLGGSYYNARTFPVNNQTNTLLPKCIQKANINKMMKNVMKIHLFLKIVFILFCYILLECSNKK